LEGNSALSEVKINNVRVLSFKLEAALGQSEKILTQRTNLVRALKKSFIKIPGTQ